MAKKKLILRKVNLQWLIDSLTEVKNTGAVFADIVAESDSKQDSLFIIVDESYMEDDNANLNTEDLI